MSSRIALSFAGLLIATAAACGGSDAAPGTTVDTVDTVDTATTATSDPAGADAPVTADSDPSTTAPPPPTTAPPAPVAVDLATVPELVAATEQALGGDGDPLVVAAALGGFPLEIPAPEGSTLYDVNSRFQRAEQGTRETSFDYWVVGPGGNVPDVDITLDDNGPGSVQIIDVYDPIMDALGFARTASTASDPGEPGGPNSVNHVYVPAEPVGTFNGVVGSAGNVFVWADEDVNGGSYSGEPVLGGYRIDIEIDTSEDEPVPVPLLDALANALPTPDAASLVAGELRVHRRSADAFEIDRGALYVAARLEWQAPADAFDAIVAFYADGTVIAPPLRAAEASFFNEGEYEPAEMYQYDATDQRLPLLLLDRYEGLLGIDAPDEGGPTVVTFDIDFDSIAPILSAPSG